MCWTKKEDTARSDWNEYVYRDKTAQAIRPQYTRLEN